ncbi:tyrosine--tRNA ligase [bacterium B13(2017)]|nr:tyrosine--tRNA ligase [bacterium B13(2017)]
MNIDEQIKLITWGVEEIITLKELKEKLSKSRPLQIKLGVDPTAPDIHLGHTVVLRKLRQFQDLGHEALLLIGSFTSQIGDPSGKSKTRPALSNSDIEHNSKTYLDQVYKILSKDRLKIVNNSDWLNSLTLKETLKLLSQATMSKLLEHNTFKDRFEQAGSIRMHEFIYPFLQAYDSIHLKADIELGGTDQLFNIAFGREMQKEYAQKPQVALLLPILAGTDGVQKMSKSLNNYIGVTDSPKTMTQKILNMPDKNIISYLKLLTTIPREEVLEIEKNMNQNPDTDYILQIKHILIDNIISIYHPDGDKSDTDKLEIKLSDHPEGLIGIIDAIILANFAKSKREAFQYIQNGAVKIQNNPVKDRNYQIDLKTGPVLLTVGKKKFITLYVIYP